MLLTHLWPELARVIVRRRHSGARVLREPAVLPIALAVGAYAAAAALAAGRSNGAYRTVIVLTNVCLYLAAFAPSTQRQLLELDKGPSLPTPPWTLICRWYIQASLPFVIWLGTAAVCAMVSSRLHVASMLVAATVDCATAGAAVLLVAGIRWHAATFLPVEVRNVGAVLARLLIPALNVSVAVVALVVTVRYVTRGVLISPEVHEAFSTVFPAIQMQGPPGVSFRAFDTLNLLHASVMLEALDGKRLLVKGDVLFRAVLAGLSLVLAWNIARRPEQPSRVELNHSQPAEAVRRQLLKRIVPQPIRVPLRLAWIAYGSTLAATASVTMLLLVLVCTKIVLVELQGEPLRFQVAAMSFGFAVFGLGGIGAWPLVELLAGGDSARRDLLLSLPLDPRRLFSQTLFLGTAMHAVVLTLQGWLWASVGGHAPAAAVLAGIASAAAVTGLILLWSGHAIRASHRPNRVAFSVTCIVLAMVHVRGLSVLPLWMMLTLELGCLAGATAYVWSAVKRLGLDRNDR